MSPRDVSIASGTYACDSPAAFITVNTLHSTACTGRSDCHHIFAASTPESRLTSPLESAMNPALTDPPRPTDSPCHCASVRLPPLTY